MSTASYYYRRRPCCRASTAAAARAADSRRCSGVQSTYQRRTHIISSAPAAPKAMSPIVRIAAPGSCASQGSGSRGGSGGCRARRVGAEGAAAAGATRAPPPPPGAVDMRCARDGAGARARWRTDGVAFGRGWEQECVFRVLAVVVGARARHEGGSPGTGLGEVPQPGSSNVWGALLLWVQNSLLLRLAARGRRFHIHIYDSFVCLMRKEQGAGAPRVCFSFWFGRSSLLFGGRGEPHHLFDTRRHAPPP